jgi:predicted Zn-dependent protease
MRVLKILAVLLTFGPLPAYAAPRQQGDAQAGAQMHERILAQFGGAYSDPELSAYVTQLGRKLASHSSQKNEDWHFTILDTPVVNAFANPGGYVYVTRGLLALTNDEAELAGVLGHEIGHITANHFAERNERGVQAGIGLIVGAVVGGLWNGKDGVRDVLETGGKLAMGYVAGHSREQEYEADISGVKLLARAGYDPFAQSDFLDSLAGQTELDAQLRGKEYNPNRVDFFDSHPATGDRVEKAIRAAKSEDVAPAKRYRGEAEFMEAIDGMIWGDTPAQGFVHGRRFEHPIMRFAFEVPEKFSIQNSDVNVVATGPNGGEFILDGGKAPTGSLERYIERDWTPQLTQGRESTPLSGLRTINVDGVEGATATLQVHYKGTMRNVQLTVYRLNGQLYRFQGIAKKGDTATQVALADAALSFEHLSEAEAAALKPYRIRVYKVREGDNLNVLAATIPMENLREERFRLMNNYDDGQELKAGDRVKLIVQ